jgi:hypothetical protein
MACQANHGFERAARVVLDRVVPGLGTVPAQEDTVARLISIALEVCSCSQAEMSVAVGVGRSKVTRWVGGECAPSLLHLVRLAAARPDVCEALVRGLQALYPERHHAARPLPARVCSCIAEFGDVAREVHLALADGRVDAGERDRILREIGHARRELDRLERDLG